jgi:hypothetical protein
MEGVIRVVLPLNNNLNKVSTVTLSLGSDVVAESLPTKG